MDEARRRECERLAVDWLAAHREFLDPNVAGADCALFARKALVEVALLVGLRARLDPSPLDDGYELLLGTVLDVSERPSYRELISRDRRALMLYAGTYAALRLCGKDDQEFRHLIEQSVSTNYGAHFERIPYRYLDMLHTFELAGIPSGGPSLQEVMPLTLLASNPNTLELSRGDMYALTHAVFYASDFGQRPVPWPAGTDAQQVTRMLEGCLALTLSQSDADLVGEMLMSLQCIGAAPSCVQDEADEWLDSWQEVTGRLEGPQGILPPDLAMANPEWRDWATAYHTTIVAVLAMLVRRCTPRGDPESHPDEPPTWDSEGPIRRAADWLISHTTPDDERHVRAVAWSAEALIRTGTSPRAMLLDLLDRRDLAEVLERQPGEVRVHLASLAARTAVASGPLASLVEAITSDLSGTADPSTNCLRTWLADVDPTWQPIDSPVPGEMDWGACDTREGSLELAIQIIGSGRHAGFSPGASAEALHALLRAAQQACVEYDIGWFAITLRALCRLPRTPIRIIEDAAAWLGSQQLLDGSIGAPLSDDRSERVRYGTDWTLLALPALIEAADRLEREQRVPGGRSDRAASDPRIATPDRGGP